MKLHHLNMDYLAINDIVLNVDHLESYISHLYHLKMNYL